MVSFQDELDLAMARAVVTTGVPTLAVCRGMQVLNVALGGTLHQHLTDSTVGHRKGLHEVNVERDSRLRAIFGCDTVPVSSYHHQAIDGVATDLIVWARAADGVVGGSRAPIRGHHRRPVAPRGPALQLADGRRLVR